mgnify:CR=1 FL=1
MLNRVIDMKQHSPGCTCCKPFLFTTGDSFFQTLLPTATGPSTGLFESTPSHVGGRSWYGKWLDDFDYPYWAKVYGGREASLGRPGRFSAFLQDTFGWWDAVPTGGGPLGIFRDKETGHYLIQIISFFYRDGTLPEATFSGMTMPRFRWGAAWYDITRNHYVGEDLEGGGPHQVPITVWPEAEQEQLPSRAIRLDGEDVLLLHTPEATPTNGGREVSDYDVAMYSPARAELSDHGRKRSRLPGPPFGGTMFKPAHGYFGGDYYETADGEIFDLTEEVLLAEYHEWRWIWDADTGYSEELTLIEDYGYTVRAEYVGELIEHFQSMETNQPHGVVKMKDGEVVERYLIPGAVSPAILTRNEAPQSRRSELELSEWGLNLYIYNSPPLGRGNTTWAANGDSCRHLVYGYKYTVDIITPVITGEVERSVWDYTDVPRPNPENINPVEMVYTEDLLGSTRVNVPSLFPYDIEAPLVDEVHDLLEWKDHRAAVFYCNNAKVLGPVPVYIGTKVYRKKVANWLGHLITGYTYDEDEYPRTVAGQPQGVVVYSDAAKDWFFIAKMTGYLVLDYDKYYSLTEGLTDQVPTEVIHQGTGEPIIGDAPVRFFESDQNPFLIFDGSMKEVGRFIVDSYPTSTVALSYLTAEHARENHPPDSNYPTWGTEGWDGKIYFGTGEAASGIGGTWRYDPSDGTLDRVYDGIKANEIDPDRDLTAESDTPPSRWYPGYLEDFGHNVQALPRNPTEAGQPPKTTPTLGFPPLTVP